MARYSSFYRRTSQALLLSFAFFLVSDIAWIGYCEVTEGSLSVFFCDHESNEKINQGPHTPLSHQAEKHADVGVRWLLSPRFTFDVGVHNVMDELYSEHLYRKVSGTQERLTAPGRSFEAKLSVQF